MYRSFRTFEEIHTWRKACYCIMTWYTSCSHYDVIDKITVFLCFAGMLAPKAIQLAVFACLFWRLLGWQSMDVATKVTYRDFDYGSHSGVSAPQTLNLFCYTSYNFFVTSRRMRLKFGWNTHAMMRFLAQTDTTRHMKQIHYAPFHGFLVPSLLFLRLCNF